MKRKMAKIRPSPNEEARIIREEQERRRRLRILQVRDQQRYIALQIRQAVEQRRQQELEQLAEELRQDWELQQKERQHTVQRLYKESLQLLGQGHRTAKENEPDLAAVARRDEENHAKAEKRYEEALKELKSQRLKERERQSCSTNARKKALQTEKERSAKVSSLPPPPPNPIQQSIDSKKPHVLKKSDVNAFAATHYHMSESTVDRDENPQQLNAHEEAELEMRRWQNLQKEEKRRRAEQFEKAHLRGKQALRREQLVQDWEHFLVELEHRQQTDLLRRRQQLSTISPQLIQPLFKKQEMREDFQRQLEFAFEDMYTGEKRVKGDLVVQIMPEPLPALSTGSQDQELDITLDEVMQHEAEQKVASIEQGTSAQVESSKPAPRQALKKLLDRIRSQRNQCTSHSSHVPGADSLTIFTHQIPELETIETGSLTSEKEDRLPEPAHSPQKQSTAAEGLLTDDTNTVQVCEEECQKREEELESEKQQQMVLLQELEEQKVKLKQMLLEAQQEREHLKAAVTKGVPVEQPDVLGQEATCVVPGLPSELEPPTGLVDHSRRIREYQQRLLEQNRIYQRSMEVARQQLEEYQQTLRIRNHITSTLMQHADMPPDLCHLSMHNTQKLKGVVQDSLTVPSNIYNNTNISLEDPTRESDMLALRTCLTDSSLTVGSKFQQDEVESFTFRNQRADLTVWLTDNRMEGVKEHHSEKLIPTSLTSEYLPYHTAHPSSSIPDQLVSVLTRATSSSVTDDPPLVPSSAAGKLWNISHDSPQTESLSSRDGGMASWKQELQEQKETVALRQEEQQQRHKVELEQMRPQKQMVQALIHTDAQHPLPEAATEALVPEIGQTRLRLLVSLLRAIEETNGGTLSHLEELQEENGSPQQQQQPSIVDQTASGTETSPPRPVIVLPSGPLPPPRAKPPVTRVKLGVMEITEQHELSAIQEVETPVNTSQVTGPDILVTFPSHTVDLDVQEDSDPSQTSNSSLTTPSLSRLQQAAEQRSGSRTNCRGSSHIDWKERHLIESDLGQTVDSPLPSDTERGMDDCCPVTCRSPTQSPNRPPDTDCPSSTTISTGSYITTDPENVDKSPPVHLCREQEQPADLLDISSPCSQSSTSGWRGVAVGSLFSDNSIQHIIDRYTRELNLSFSTAGRITGSKASHMEEPGSSFPQSWVQSSERKGELHCSADRHYCLSDAAGTQTSDQEMDNAASPVLEQPELETFRPLTCCLTDQSSCLTVHCRDSAMEQLLGQPWAHSSMIAQPRGLPGSVDLVQGGWNSTLSRMTSRLSHRPSSVWISGGQDFYAGQLMEPLSTMLDDVQEGNPMRPLVGELNTDGSSGAGTDRSKTSEATLLPYPCLPEASLHCATMPSESTCPEEQTLQNLNKGPHGTEDEGSDSFHPLLAEVTQNETTDQSMTFRLLQNNVPISPEGQSAIGVCPETQVDLSPEHLREDKPATNESSQNPSWESVLGLEETMRTNVELTALSLSYLSLCDDTSAQGVFQPPREAADTSLRPPASVPSMDLCVEELKSEQGSSLRKHVPVLGKTEELVSEKGILEQSEITMVSLTEATAEEDSMCDYRSIDGEREDRQSGQDTEVSGSQLIIDHRDYNPPPVTFLHFECDPSRGLQAVSQHKQRLSTLLQRSCRRVEDIRTRWALAKAPSEVDKLGSCLTKNKPEPPREMNRSQRGGAELPGFIKPQPPPSVSSSRPKGKAKVTIQTSVQRKLDASEMYQRTQRLYEQLEEVKQQRAIRSRQEASAKNRLKAQEFHKVKTLLLMLMILLLCLSFQGEVTQESSFHCLLAENITEAPRKADTPVMH
ncbi:centrosomal protein of 295 kDa isoform X3 [Echeneis naucrates]|uniref:centrosomal protein of 295 kDa isoform X3 n=1 Tax=Echeneis naucrates TaxID=173247 RepID=UPI00111376F4|nr:centrosomal protein of 295 kDa isoform X3 [Echeneis naucrates]